MKAYQRGFFCGDTSITYPYLEREAIPDGMLIAGGIIITGLTVRRRTSKNPSSAAPLSSVPAHPGSISLDPPQIALGECYRVRFRSVHSRAFVRNLYVSCLYKELGSFLFGCCVGQSLTNMAKLSVGRLRPNFLSVCNITYASIKCTSGSYVPSISCQQSNPKLEEEARCVERALGAVCLVRSRWLTCNPHATFYCPSLAGSLFSPATLPLQCTQCSTWL